MSYTFDEIKQFREDAREEDMTSTIDELSRHKDEREFVPSSSNPLLSIAKHYDVPYSSVLLYCDNIRDKTYLNEVHEDRGVNDILALGGRGQYTECARHIQKIVEKFGQLA